MSIYMPFTHFLRNVAYADVSDIYAENITNMRHKRRATLASFSEECDVSDFRHKLPRHFGRRHYPTAPQKSVEIHKTNDL
jgi:hypothetical protein